MKIQMFKNQRKAVNKAVKILKAGGFKPCKVDKNEIFLSVRTYIDQDSIINSLAKYFGTPNVNFRSMDTVTGDETFSAEVVIGDIVPQYSKIIFNIHVES